jgi:predicted RNA-binding Zn ribbon-like protein
METLCIDFLNSDWGDFRGRWREDRLLQPAWVEQFLVRWNIEVPQPLDAASLFALQAQRTLLRRMIEALAHAERADDDLASLNALLRLVPFTHQLTYEGEGYGLELLPLERDWNWVQVQIALSFVEMLIEHDPHRMKICENPGCRGIFYDESKSRTRRYCTKDKCANLMKLRRFRARHRPATQEEV